MNVTIYDWDDDSSIREQLEADSIYDAYSASNDGLQSFLCLWSGGELVKKIPIERIAHAKFYLLEPKGASS